jgi:ethanolamine transporter
MNETGTIGFISTLATSVTTFGMMKDMDDKSVVLNSAFAVSAAFTLADHLAYTLSFKAEYLPAVTAGKLISGILAVALAAIIYKKSSSGEKKLVK